MSYRESWPTPSNSPRGETTREATTPNPEYEILSPAHHGSGHPSFPPPSQDRSQYSRLDSPVAGIQPWHSPGPMPARSVGNQGMTPPISARPRIHMWSTFRRRYKNFYTFGRVFKMVPHEKVGAVPNSDDEKFVTQDCFGRNVISKPRICIVVEKHNGFCNVLTVNGYGDRSLEKKFTNASEHAVARTELDLSPPSSEEFLNKAEQMLQQPICITPGLVGREHSFLHPASVVDFGRVMCVQHYHEVEEFGFVAGESLETLHEYYNHFRNKCSAPKNVDVSTEHSIPRALGSVVDLPRPQVSPGYLDPGRAITWTSPHPTYRTIAHRLNDHRMPDVHKYISNSAGTEEERDGAFKQQPREFFSYGKVFRLLSWLEEPLDEESAITHMIPIETESGVPVLRRVLWLVVIQEGAESCKCLRILTYEGRGVSDLPPGVSICDHSIVYTGRQIPDPLPNEMNPSQRMGIPIRVRIDNRMEKLFPTARLLWTRVYEVKLDVKAKAFGRVSSRCDYAIETQFRQLNPQSSINARCRRNPESCSMATKDDESDHEAGKLAGEYGDAGQLSHSDDDGSDEGPASMSASSELFDDSQNQNTERTYDPGAVVVLLTGKDGPSAGPTLKEFVINTARVKRNDDKELVWEYNLNYPHGGRFSGGRYFDEELLWPA